MVATARRGLSSRALTSKRYVVCLALLIGSAVGTRTYSSWLGAHFRKEAVPLKRDLALLDWSKLEPDYRLHLVQPPRMSEEDTEKLGTQMYIQAQLVTTRLPRDHPARIANLLVTYYTDKPDLVPHTPEACYLAGGYDRLGDAETAEVRVPGVGAPDDRVPVRVLQFRARDRDVQPTVLYFFHTNGEYKTTRDGVRLKLANPFERYGYYAKIEVTFNDDPEGRQRPRQADKNESIAALGPLLRTLLPVLLQDHFGWDRVATAAPAGGP